MPITDHNEFNRLCTLSGITESYYDIRGVHHVADSEAKQTLLAAMQIAAENDNDVLQSLEYFRLREWQNIIAPALVYQRSESNKQVTLTFSTCQIEHPVQWQIIEERGQVHRGSWEFAIENAVDQCDFNGSRLFQFKAHLPEVSEFGYHQLKLELSDGSLASSLLIVTPASCYQPSVFEAGKKLWGVSLQLYSLRSKRNWGIGDFTDLRAAIKILAPLGVEAIGLNPLHALFSHLPENASPYSPSNRDFLNPIYLDIESMDAFKQSDAAQRLVYSGAFQSKLQSLREPELVNYTGVWSAKLAVLELLYRQFRGELLVKKSSTCKNFRRFQIDGAEDLFKFSVFEALQNFFHQQDASIETWQQWPHKFQDPGSVSVTNWAKVNVDKIEFYQYLQWQAEQQLAKAQDDCVKPGMRIGIYNDLAVGNERFSSACWAEQSQYALDAGVGAPPDDFNLLGQNWGLPPQIPRLLFDNAYRLFIRTLQANMRNAGALRIDHVMGLMRLYWIPANYTADQGTYVSYPLDDLLGILALESQRNRCLIIGEDLGTVPDEVRHQLWLKKILSYRVLLFEKDWHHGTFKPPHEYPQIALCTSGSHDLPTLRGFWQELDLDLRETLNLYPSDDIKQQLRDTRERDKFEIKAALVKENLLTDKALHEDNSTQEFNREIFLSIQRFLARSEALMMMVQLEDILLLADQVNLPGTITQYPNWRYKISINLEDWLEQSDIESIATAINLERNI